MISVYFCCQNKNDRDASVRRLEKTLYALDIIITIAAIITCILAILANNGIPLGPFNALSGLPIPPAAFLLALGAVLMIINTLLFSNVWKKQTAAGEINPPELPRGQSFAQEKKRKGPLPFLQIQIDQYDLTNGRPFDSCDLDIWFRQISAPHREFACPQFGKNTNLNDSENDIEKCVDKLCKKHPNASMFAFHLRLSGPGWSHFTLVYIDCQRFTVEFYDSVGRSANHPQVVASLKKVAEYMTKVRPAQDNRPYTVIYKIEKSIQAGDHDCGAWVLYFLKHRLSNPNINFNLIPPKKRNREISNFRHELAKEAKAKLLAQAKQHNPQQFEEWEKWCAVNNISKID